MVGDVLCIVAQLAAALTSTQQVVGVAIPPSVVTTKTSPDRAKRSWGGMGGGGGQMTPQLRTSGSDLVIAC